MSNIKALDKLRELATGSHSYISNGRVLEFVKEIEQEITERYIELPVDDDGVPIHAGDMLEYEEYVTHKIKESRVVALEYRVSTEDWIVNCSQWTNPHETRHVKPRTIEDVLRDVIGEYERAPMDDYDAVQRIAAKYAEEIRGMMA